MDKLQSAFQGPQGVGTGLGFFGLTRKSSLVAQSAYKHSKPQKKGIKLLQVAVKLGQLCGFRPSDFRKGPFDSGHRFFDNCVMSFVCRLNTLLVHSHFSAALFTEKKQIKIYFG